MSERTANLPISQPKSMKKLVIFAVILACGLVFGCDIEEQKPGISTVKNTSANFDVTYQFKDNSEHTLAKGSNVSFERPLYDYILSYKPSKRVILNTQYPHKNDVIYTFSERKSYSITVKNNTGESITLSADGWMDEITLTSVSTEQSNATWLIYTDKPSFTATSSSGYPANASYNLNGNTFKVVISWGN